MNYKTTIVCFCYEGDQDILKYSLKAANIVFGDELKIALIDDALKPISNDTIENLKKDLTCEFIYEVSHFNRNINLNGKECIENIVDRFIKHSKDREGLVIKLDPDTMINRRDIFDMFMTADNVEYMAPYRPGCQFSGMCYAIKTSLLEAGRKMIDNFNIPENEGAEDYIIGLAMCAASIPKLSGIITLWQAPMQTTGCAAWNYANKCDEKNIEYYYKLSSTTTYGNWFMYKGLNKHDREEPMRIMLDKIKGQNSVKFTINATNF